MKQWGWTQGRCKKSAEYLLPMPKNAESNVELKALDVDSLVIEQTQMMQHKTHRAHGRIHPRMSSPCHMEMILTEKDLIVPKPEEELHRRKRCPRRKEILQPGSKFSIT